MKLKCNRCNKTLTQDLYVVPYKDHLSKRVWEKSTYIEKWEDADGESHENEEVKYTFKSGVCYVKPVTPSSNWSSLDMHSCDSKKQIIDVHGNTPYLHYFRVNKRQPKMIVCSGESVLGGVIPEFVSGYGCCNWSMGADLKCGCGNPVGHMYLDCYEDGTVEFIDGKVVRTYKNS